MSVKLWRMKDDILTQEFVWGLIHLFVHHHRPSHVLGQLPFWPVPLWNMAEGHRSSAWTSFTASCRQRSLFITLCQRWACLSVCVCLVCHMQSVALLSASVVMTWQSILLILNLMQPRGSFSRLPAALLNSSYFIWMQDDDKVIRKSAGLHTGVHTLLLITLSFSVCD